MNASNMTRGCPGSFWQTKTVGRCQQQRYLELVPISLALAFAVIYTLLSILFYKNTDIKNGSHQQESDSSLVFPAPNASDRQAQIIIRTRSTGDKLRLMSELVLSISLALTSYFAWSNPSVSDQYCLWAPNVPTVFLLSSLYTLLLVIYRTYHANTVYQLTARPYVQCAFIYSFYALIFTAQLYSQAVEPYSANSFRCSAVSCALAWLLWVILFSSPIGDSAARLYTSNGTIPSTEPTSSLLRIIFCSWNSKMILQSVKKEKMDPSDVWDLEENNHLYKYFEDFNKTDPKRSFFVRVIICLKKPIALNLFYGVLGSILTLVPTIFVKLILTYVEDPSVPRPVAWMYVVGFAISHFLHNVTSNQAFYHGRILSLGFRGLIIGNIYRKALYRQVAVHKPGDIEPANDGDTEGPEDDESETFNPNSMGAVINLMSVDSFKVADFVSYLHDNIASPVALISSLFFLYNVLGWSVFAGFAVMVVSTPISGYIAAKFTTIQDKLMAVTDKRVEKTNEVLQAIRIIKFFAWERRFADGILEVREKELKLLYRRALYWTLQGVVFFLLPVAIVATSFWSYIYLGGNVLTSSVAFTAFSIFRMLQFPLDDIANIITRVTSCRVSARRISSYLSEPETPKYSQLSSPYGPNGEEVIGFENATFTWSGQGQDDSNPAANSDAFKLRDINAKFIVGDLNVIIGPTGSGKSSLLLALLGEMHMESGKIYLPCGVRQEAKENSTTGLADTVAYAPQQPWLVNDTIKNNVLFAANFDKARYNAVLDACELRRDLEILSDGDQTLIGDKGIALSGGQKQRISLARALYSNSKHLILDDCLSAVDSHTAEGLYKEALNGKLSAGRTIILVSHNVALTVGEAAKVFVVNDGRVVAQGPPGELSKAGALGDDALVNLNAQSATQSRQLSRVNSSTHIAGSNTVVSHIPTAEEQVESAIGLLELGQSTSDDVNQAPVDNKVDEETRNVGAIDIKTYASYIRDLGGLRWFLITTLVVVAEPLARYLESFWIKVWASSYDNSNDTIGLVASRAITYRPYVTKILIVFEDKLVNTGVHPDTAKALAYYVTIYVLLGILDVFLCMCRDICFLFGSVVASRKIFARLLDSVIHARVRFFDATPIGRITNRFSKDIEDVDQEMSSSLMFFVCTSVDAITITLVISFITPQFIPAAVLIVFAFSYVGHTYLCCSRELKRLESTARSPIFQQFGETLSGAVTIRAFGDSSRFLTLNWNAVDYSHRPYFWLWLANRWLSFWSAMVSMLVVVSSSFFVILNYKTINSGMAGIALTYAIGFGDTMLWLVRCYAMVEVEMNSLERIKEYVSVDQEAAGIIEESRPPSNWPEQGSIHFKKLSLRYADDLPLVIKDVSFNVDGGLKVGVVGRTGAGKSTIITALFRLLEPVSGSIEIDGLDISTIGLEDLRRGLAIIPQDPTLFVGSLRSNLDLFNEYTDDEMFSALAKAQLVPEGTSTETISVEGENGSESNELNNNKFLNLDEEITEGGQNLSQGQRQLLCLARSILKNPRILLLDEATASIDYDTDAMIQKTIREAFTNVTILTIAHRLRTIADYDRILVLEKGEVAQYGRPSELLKDKNGLFYSMCEKSGELEALVALAQ